MSVDIETVVRLVDALIEIEEARDAFVDVNARAMVANRGQAIGYMDISIAKEHLANVVLEMLGRPADPGFDDIAATANQIRIAAAAANRAVPDWLRREVLARDGAACKECGAMERLAIDHIHPFSKGGLTVAENLQVLCGTCNSKKGARV